VQSAVQQKTLGKIQVFGADGWKQPLLAALPSDILPVQWGGTKIVAGDVDGICMGGEVTLEYLEQAQPEEIPGMGEICQMKIEAGSEITVPYKVDKDCDLRWKFKSEGGDLGFAVHRRETEKDTPTAFIDVLTRSRVSSHKDLQAGVLSGKAGFTYLLCFDNTFSRFKAKTVIYSVISETGAGGDELSICELVKCARDGMGKDELTKKKKKNHKNSKKSKSLITKKNASR